MAIKSIDPETEYIVKAGDISNFINQVKSLLDSLDVDDNHGGGILSVNTLKIKTTLQMESQKFQSRIKIK